MPREKIVAVGLLTQRDVDMLGHGFSRLWPVDDSRCFSELLQRIDEAERELEREAEQAEAHGARRKGRRKADSDAVPGGGRY